MMADSLKNPLLSVLSLTFALAISALMLCGCSDTTKMINPKQMPGHRFSDVLKGTGASQVPTSSKTGVTRTKSGVYIYKDESVTNTTGYNFKYSDKTDVGPQEVRFDAEKFKTKY